MVNGICKRESVVLAAMREVPDLANAKTMVDEVGFLCVRDANGSLGEPGPNRLTEVVGQLVSILDRAHQRRIDTHMALFRNETPGACDWVTVTRKVQSRRMGARLPENGPHPHPFGRIRIHWVLEARRSVQE